MSENVHCSSSQAAAGVSLVTVIIALIFLFVWPGPFRYDYRDWPVNAAGAQKGQTLIKIDRITHTFWLYNDGEWQKQ